MQRIIRVYLRACVVKNIMTKNKNDPDNIVNFPDRKEQQQKWRAEYKAQKTPTPAKQPFLNIGNIPIFTRILTALIALVSLPLLILSQTGLVPDILYDASFIFGFVPARLTSSALSLIALFSLVSHAFIHGGFVHFAFNTIMLLALGTLFEKRYGGKQTFIFFFACVNAGALTFLAFAPHATMPVIGASGGVSGLFAAALVLMHDMRGAHGIPPRKVGLLGRFGPWGMVMVWLVLMLALGSFGGGNIAWQSHLGGYICGALYCAVLRYRKA